MHTKFVPPLQRELTSLPSLLSIAKVYVDLNCLSIIFTNGLVLFLRRIINRIRSPQKEGQPIQCRDET